MPMPKKYLYDIAFMRPVIILLVVIYHSFAMYAGIWAAPDGLSEIPLYMWICKFAQGFHIEGMAFIAGYVFSFQCISLNKRQTLGSFALKKAKRLYIPSIVFGALYYFFFIFESDTFRPFSFIIQLLDGVAHLWFLPMLFWCFMGLWFIDKYCHSKNWFLLALLGFISVLPTPYIPLGLQKIPHFLFYCYLGYLMYKKHDVIPPKICNLYAIISLWILYFLLCCFAIRYASSLQVSISFLTTSKPIVLSLLGIVQLFISCSGILALYSTVEFAINKLIKKQEQSIVRVGNLSFGVYLCHLFILIGLYYHTALLTIVGPYWLPWVGLAISFMGSMVITYLTLKTKTGRFLMQ